ncbi:response regulator transcription factor [Providencia sp.]
MLSVLLVDDHPAICFALKLLIEKTQKFEVDTTNGDDLIYRIDSHKYNLIILDLELKHCNGLDILPRIKAHNSEVKVLIFSSQPPEIYALRTYRSGADGFISKNMDLDTIASICQLLVDGYQCFPSFVLNKIQECTTPSADKLEKLSDRELTVLQSLASGKGTKEISQLLNVSPKTVGTYKMRIIKKCAVDNIDIVINLLKEDR